MWVFDGEEWYEEGGGPKPANSSDEQQFYWDMLQPELQIVEIAREEIDPVPPFPLP